MLANIYLTRWFFVVFVLAIGMYVAAFSIPNLEFIADVTLASLFGVTAIDTLLVFSNREPIHVQRTWQERFNLGETNKIKLKVENLSNQPFHFILYEGFPIEMQERSRSFGGMLAAGGERTFDYTFTPKSRGEFSFGDITVRIRSVFFLVSRRVEISASGKFHVYPSVLQMKKYELLVFHQQKVNSGIKKIRRLGNNSEFEQIKNYIQGDDLRTVNWKATSRKNELMVNQYQEEKSQSVYCIIDKSRNMEMDFDGLSFLDYSINASLVLSNIAIRKGDKAGLITYSDKIGTVLPAERSAGQMRRMIEALYNQRTRFKEASYDLLYQSIRRSVRSRSLIVLFTNFESEFTLKRALPILRQINQKHVLVVVMFENKELQDLAFGETESLLEVYQSTVAERMISYKSMLAQTLRQNGIHTVLTLPEDLSVNTINKYLELKAKGAI
ncbi:MAG: DUF58 domain-containing protein [Bacteroidetes bacterium]|nr:MAG: DUF58 domain-containing protein [Bacteroidota bacterium]